MNKLLLTGIILSLLGNFVLALILVWANTQRAGLAYDLKRQQRQIAELANHGDKLGVERDRLLSPYYLDRKAAQQGLRSAEQNQKRFMH